MVIDAEWLFALSNLYSVSLERSWIQAPKENENTYPPPHPRDLRLCMVRLPCKHTQTPPFCVTDSKHEIVVFVTLQGNLTCTYIKGLPNELPGMTLLKPLKSDYFSQ